jgi:hypothetical protein
MRDQEILGLMEAYSSIYTPQQELTEEVQIAAQYFYEMGLNEDGVDILIEELGVEEFAQFVYDIAEEYVLTEARAGGAKIEVKTAKGKEIEGKPTAASLKRLRAKKAERKAGEEEASAAKPSGMKASLQRQSAVAAAAKKQPKKPGLLDRVAGAVNRGIERHNKAMGELDKMKAATAVTVGKVKKAAGEFKKGLTSEEIEYVDEERREPNFDKMKRQENRHREKAVQQRGGSRGDSKNRAFKMSGIRNSLERGEDPRADTYGGARTARGNAPEDHRAGFSKNPLNNPPRRVKKPGVAEETNLFDYILEHLVAEGYADTNKAALAIMANMSEEWKQSILDEEAPRRIAIEPSSPRLMPNAGPARVHDPKKSKKVVRK